MGTRQPMPLSGIKVIDLTRFLAGPYCASLLADFGADVIRVEPPEGGEDRGLVPIGSPAGGALFQQVNRNKRAIALDIRQEEGRALLEQLIKEADVVLTNMPVATLRRARLDHETLRSLRHDLVTANISGFGRRGPLAARNGFDGVGQVMSGAAYLAGNPRVPRRAGCSYVDYATGLAAALGVMAALIHRRNTGEGQDVEASLFATALTFANPWHIEEALLDLGRRPFGNRSPNSAPSDIFPTSDGAIVVQVIGSQMFARWAQLVGREDLLGRADMAGDAARGRKGTLISRVMRQWTRQRSTAEAIETLSRHGIPAGPVLSPRQVIDDAMIAETGVLEAVKLHGVKRTAPMAGTVVNLQGVDSSIKSCAPVVGQDTREVLASAGLSLSTIDALISKGIVALGTRPAAPSASTRKKSS